VAFIHTALGTSLGSKIVDHFAAIQVGNTSHSPGGAPLSSVLAGALLLLDAEPDSDPEPDSEPAPVAPPPPHASNTHGKP
jgi:hypothetical protein